MFSIYKINIQIILLLIMARNNCSVDEVIYVSSSPEDFEGWNSADEKFLDRTKIFLSLWDNVNYAIETFITEYNARNQTQLFTLYQLEKVDRFEAGSGSLYGTLRLKFWYQKNGQDSLASVFVKVPQLSALYALGKERMNYDREKYMYETILPLISRNWPHDTLWPHFYGSSAYGALVIENLRESEFYPALNSGHDSAFYLQTLKSLAQFHALSTTHTMDVVQLSYLDYLSVADKSTLLERDGFFFPILAKFKKHLLPQLTEDVMNRFRIATDNLDTVLMSAHSRNPTGLNVILLGNPSWVNVFFQCEIEDCMIAKSKFVNFHNIRRGSPVIDVMHYLMTSVLLEVLQEEGDTLFLFYLEEFKSTLEELDDNNESVYSFDKFRTDTRMYKLYFFLELIVVVPQHWLRFESVGMGEEEDAYDKLFKSQDYISFFNFWMRLLE